MSDQQNGLTEPLTLSLVLRLSIYYLPAWPPSKEENLVCQGEPDGAGDSWLVSLLRLPVTKCGSIPAYRGEIMESTAEDVLEVMGKE